MSFLRRRAACLSASVLLVQLVAFAASAGMAAVCCRRAIAGPARVMDCCKGEGHSCPLMKKQQAPADSDSSMESCPGTDERVASLVFGGRGMLRLTTSTGVVPRVIALTETRHRGAASRPVLVETPPPRA